MQKTEKINNSFTQKFEEKEKERNNTFSEIIKKSNINKNLELSFCNPIN